VIELVYETHALTVDNERGLATGWLPGELSSSGRRLARELGERRRDDGIAAVFCSDLHRAVETAEIAFAGSGIPIHRDARLRECDYGELNGAPVERIDATRLERIEVPFPGGESYMDVVRRTHDFLDDPGARHCAQREPLGPGAPDRRDLAHRVRQVAFRVAAGMGVRRR
jgi:broad specificity phosphatase PhoE